MLNAHVTPAGRAAPVPDTRPHYHILLVEDHAPLALAASTMIESLGYSYLVAAGGLEGIESFRHHRFDLVLMDLQMPKLDGADTALKLRQMEREKGWPATPIVAMTAYIGSADMGKCTEAGMDDIIPKPFHPDYFSKMLAKFCQKPAA